MKNDFKKRDNKNNNNNDNNNRFVKNDQHTKSAGETFNVAVIDSNCAQPFVVKYDSIIIQTST